jgi:hypothetical protein
LQGILPVQAFSLHVKWLLNAHGKDDVRSHCGRSLLLCLFIRRL